MKRQTLHATITFVAIFLAIGHLIWPDARIDAITLALLVIAILPWLGSVFRSLELPGGMKVEYHELEKAKARIEATGLIATSPTKKVVPSYTIIADHDPNLALAGLRIEIEKKLRAIAVSAGITDERLLRMIRELAAKGLLTQEETAAIIHLIGILNAAVHAVGVDQRAVEWAFEFGPQLLASLDERVKKTA